MNAGEFYTQVSQAFTLPPQPRHAAMLSLHTQVMEAYIAAIQRISAQQALQPVSTGTDRRTLAQVVAHIAEWERFGILAAGDLLAGVQHPRTVTAVHGFIDTDGRVQNFADVHEFNAYQERKYATFSWPQLQADAVNLATTFHALFAHSQLLTAARLEQTLPHRKRLGNGDILENTTMGWCLWVIYLDHEAVEHAVELGLPQ